MPKSKRANDRSASRGRSGDVDRKLSPSPPRKADSNRAAMLRSSSSSQREHSKRSDDLQISPRTMSTQSNGSERTMTSEHRNRSVDSSLDKLQDSIASDASNLLDKFRLQFDKTAIQFQMKPNVLVAGCTGAGKSTLINRVFGRSVAQTGTGVPITQHFDRYELEGETVVIYDSKGLEVGEHEEFIRTTGEFLEDGHVQMHVVWYIINSAGSRFQPFEADVCKSLFNKLPIIFILNKADLSPQEDRDALRKAIVELNLGNCLGILDTICTPSLAALKIPDVCPACGSDDLDIKRKRKLMTCEECGHSEKLMVETGLDVLVEHTMNALPVLARDRFVAAQRVSMHAKNTTARQIIVDFHDNDFRHARLERQLFKVVAKMLIRLSILWEFREHGHEYGTEIAKEHMGQYSLRDRVFLLMHKQDKQSEEKLNHCTALGVVWNRCVRELYKALFLVSFGDVERNDADLSVLVERAFTELHIDAIDATAHSLEDQTFETLLDAEFPPELEADAACAVEVPLNRTMTRRESKSPDHLEGHNNGDGHHQDEHRASLLGTTGHYMMHSNEPGQASAPSHLSSTVAGGGNTGGSSVSSSSSKHRHRHSHKHRRDYDDGSGSVSSSRGRHVRAHGTRSSSLRPPLAQTVSGSSHPTRTHSMAHPSEVSSSMGSSHGHRRHLSVDVNATNGTHASAASAAAVAALANSNGHHESLSQSTTPTTRRSSKSRR